MDIKNPEDLTVVVVDDQPIICQFLADQIDKISGATIVGIATSIAAALDRINELQPHLVVLDISMPRFGDLLNGIDVLKWIKQHHPGINVIIHTSYSGPMFREKCQQLGAYVFLNKADGPELLHPIITQLIGEHTNTSDVADPQI